MICGSLFEKQICFCLRRALRRWEKLKNEIAHMEQARRYVSRRSSAPSTSTPADHDGNDDSRRTTTDELRSSKLKRRSVRPDDHAVMAPLARVLPERFIERTREKQSQRTHYRKCNDLKLAFSEFYLMLVLLQNYQTLNFTGFRKILKKHDKLFQTIRGEEWR